MAKNLFFGMEVVEAAPPPVVELPLFLMAYWSRGPWWKVFEQMYSETMLINEQSERLYGPSAMRLKIEDLQSKGWSYVTVCRVPDVQKYYKEKVNGPDASGADDHVV